MTTSDKSKLEDRKKEAEKKEKNSFPSKVVIRRLPSSMNETEFLEAVSPLPEHNYLRFVRADLKMGQHAFSRAYINFVNQEDIYLFQDKFDGYVFVDNKGNEFQGLVEFAPNPKVTPVRENRRKDLKMATIEQDPDYVKFLESLQEAAEVQNPITMEKNLEEIELNEREKKAGRGLDSQTTPLLQFIKDKKGDKLKKREEQKEQRRKREEDRKKARDEERIKRKEMRERDQREWDRRDRDKTDGRKGDLKKVEREKEIQHEKDLREKCREKIKELNAEESRKKNGSLKDDKSSEIQETRVFTNSARSERGDKDVDKENKSEKDRKEIEKEKKLAREEREKERFRKREEERRQNREKKREQEKEKREKEKERREKEREERKKQKETKSGEDKSDKPENKRRDQKREDNRTDDKREEKPDKWTDSNWKEVPKDARSKAVAIEEKNDAKEDTGAPKTKRYSDRRKEEKARREKEKQDKMKKKDGDSTLVEGMENMSIDANIDKESVAEKYNNLDKEGKKIPEDSVDSAASMSEREHRKEAHKEYKRDGGSKYTEEEKQKYREKRREQERERREAKEGRNVRNKERPAMQIYRPGMGKFSSRTIKKGEESPGQSPRASRDSSPKKSSRSGSPEEGKRDDDKNNSKKDHGSKDAKERDEGKKRGRGKKYDDYYEEDCDNGKKYGTKEYGSGRGGKKGYGGEYYYEEQGFKRGGGRGRGGYRGHKDDGYYYGSGRGYKEEGYYEKNRKGDRKRKSESEGKSSDERSEKEGSAKLETIVKSPIKEETEVIDKEDNTNKSKVMDEAKTSGQEDKQDAKKEDAPQQKITPNPEHKSLADKAEIKKMTEDTVKSVSTTEKQETAPEKPEVAPEKPKSSPEKPLVAPDKSELAPEKSEVAPEKPKSSPEKPEAAPEKPEFTVRRVSRDENVITLEDDE